MVNKLIWIDEDTFFITSFNKKLYDDYDYINFYKHMINKTNNKSYLLCRGRLSIT